VVLGGEKLWRSGVEIERGAGGVVFCGGSTSFDDGGCGGGWP
jgi:hypothetical protein